MVDIIYVLGVVFLCLGGTLWLYPLFFSITPLSRKILSAILCVVSALSIGYYTRFGDFHHILPKYKSQNIHLAEIYTYYVGSKYFTETGYFNLFGYTAVAYQEIRRLKPDFPMPLYDIRDLRDKLKFVPSKEIIPRYQDSSRQAFSPERWHQFKNDVEVLYALGPYNLWWRETLFDCGFNSSPAFVLVAGNIANGLPLNSWWKYLGYFDFLLLAVGAFFIYRSFGLFPLCGFLIIYGMNPLSNYYWTGGSFFRQLWFFSLVIGLCFFKKERYALAGLFLGYSVMDRGFPVLFVFGACYPLVCDAVRKRTIERPLKYFSICFFLTILFLFILSSMQYGLSSWKDFMLNIRNHNSVIWIPHVGLKKTIVYFPGIEFRDFWWSEGLMRLAEWNRQLRLVLASRSQWFYSSQAILCLGSLWACRREKPVISAMIIGPIFLYCLFLPAAYYYVFLALYPVVLFPDSPDVYAGLKAAAAFSLTLILLLIPIISPDDIIKFTLNSYALGVFFLFMILIYALPNIKGLAKQSPRPGNNQIKN